MKEFLENLFATCRPFVGMFFAVLGVLFGIDALSAIASAQTDITATVSSLSTLWDTIEALAIGIILFVLGRKLLRKV